MDVGITGRETRADFSGIAPTSVDYAALPVAEAFTWSAWARAIDRGEWYLVAFRSVMREGADEALLWEYDTRAFDEAGQAPGFVHYHRGMADELGRCLSFCLWDSREQAREASRRPAHVEALGLVEEMYESYVLEFLRVTKRPSAGGLEFEDYDGTAPGLVDS